MIHTVFIGHADVNLAVETAEPTKGRVHSVGSVGRPDHHHLSFNCKKRGRKKRLCLVSSRLVSSRHITSHHVMSTRDSIRFDLIRFHAAFVDCYCCCQLVRLITLLCELFGIEMPRSLHQRLFHADMTGKQEQQHGTDTNRVVSTGTCPRTSSDQL